MLETERVGVVPLPALLQSLAGEWHCSPGQAAEQLGYDTPLPDRILSECAEARALGEVWALHEQSQSDDKHVSKAGYEQMVKHPFYRTFARELLSMDGLERLRELHDKPDWRFET